MVHTRTILATLALLTTSTTFAASIPRIGIFPRQNSTSGCYSGVYVIAARGSEESPGEGSTQQVSDLITAAIPNSGSVAVNYPASVADPVYPESVSDGITDAINKVHAYVDKCGSKARIVLLGFSQGGNVMTDALAGGDLKPTPLDSNYASHITGVCVFGDPTFTAGQSFDQGTSTSNGIFSRGGSSLAKLNTYASKLQSYCNTGDIYCASGDDSSVHGTECPTYAQPCANFIKGLAGSG